MSAPQVFFWPSRLGSSQFVAFDQVVGPDLVMKVNGNLPNFPTSVKGSDVYLLKEMMRTIAFYSDANLSSLTISITGLSAPVQAADPAVDPSRVGNPTEPFTIFTETINGPGGTVTPVGKFETETLRIYQRVDSIVLSASTVTNSISAGLGKNGLTNYFSLNLNSSAPQNWAFQSQPIYPAKISELDDFKFKLFGSLTQPNIINAPSNPLVIPFPFPIPAFEIGSGTGSENGYVSTQGIVFFSPLTILWVQVNDETVLRPEESIDAYFTFVQQGIAR